MAFVKCNQDALFFAGPQLSKLLVVSTVDGRVLWEDPYDNYQLVIRSDGLYAISGPWGQNISRRFDPLTGEVLAQLPVGRRACTRPTGTCDSILFRAMGGSVRYDVASAATAMGLSDASSLPRRSDRSQWPTLLVALRV